MKKLKQAIPQLQDTIISIVIVTQNDSDIIESRLFEVEEELKKFKSNYELIVIDNSSSDLTLETLAKITKIIRNLRIIVLSKEYQKEIALTAGIDTSIGDYTILFDIYTNPASVIPTVIDNLLKGYDVVIGNAKPSLKKSFFTKILLKLVKQMSSHSFEYSNTYLFGLSRKATNSIMRTRRKNRNLNYLNYLIGLKKYSFDYKPLNKYLRKLSRENFFQVFSRVIDTVISNSFKPIRFLSFLGVFLSVLFILYIVSVVLLDLIFKSSLAPKGWVSVSTVLGVMFLLLFSLLTLISEYIIRILNESRNEPFYFISDEFDKSIIRTSKDLLNIV